MQYFLFTLKYVSHVAHPPPTLAATLPVTLPPLYPSLSPSFSPHSPRYLDDEAFGLLMTLGPSSLDTELRLLSPHSGGTMNLLNEFCVMTLECLTSRRHYELINSYFSLFIQVSRSYHSSVVG